MTGKVHPLLYWAPRCLSILFIFFLSLFSLDVVWEGTSFLQILGGLFLHNIPVLILLLFLVIAWRLEIVGGVAYILAGFFYIGMLLGRVVFAALSWRLFLAWSLAIAGPAFLIGILFLIGWRQKRRTT